MQILSSREAYNYLRRLMTADVEEFWVTALRSDKRVIRTECLFRGTVDSCQSHPRDVFRFACIHNASAIIIAHNHPSHDPSPSSADTHFTRRLMQASRIMQIPLIDHIIVTERGYYSFADKHCNLL